MSKAFPLVFQGMDCHLNDREIVVSGIVIRKETDQFQVKKGRRTVTDFTKIYTSNYLHTSTQVVLKRQLLILLKLTHI